MPKKKQAATFAADIPRCWVDRVPLGFGLRLYACFSRNSIGPIGLVWGFGVGERFEVMHSYTLPFARRQGVRTLINDAIVADGVKVITTYEGSEEGGNAFLQSCGYTRHRKECNWSLVAKRKRK